MGKRWLLIGIVVIVLAALGYAVYTLTPFIREKTGAPREQALEVVLGSVINGTAYTLSKGALSEAPQISEGSLVSRFRRPQIGQTLSFIMPPNTLGAALILETSEGFRQLGGPSSMKDAGVLSFDGGLVAYAELNAPPGSILYSENISDWRVRVLNVATGEENDLGVGYAPHFVGENPDTLVFSSPEGIVSTDLEGVGASAVFAGSGVESVVHAARVSPDGAHMVTHNELTGQWNIYTVTQAHPLALSALGAVQSSFDSVALSNTFFYGAHRDESTGATTLWRYPLDAIAPFMALEDGELIYSFANGEIPYQIVP